MFLSAKHWRKRGKFGISDPKIAVFVPKPEDHSEKMEILAGVEINVLLWLTLTPSLHLYLLFDCGLSLWLLML